MLSFILLVFQLAFESLQNSPISAKLLFDFNFSIEIANLWLQKYKLMFFIQELLFICLEAAQIILFLLLLFVFRMGLALSIWHFLHYLYLMLILQRRFIFLLDRDCGANAFFLVHFIFIYNYKIWAENDQQIIDVSDPDWIQVDNLKLDRFK